MFARKRAESLHRLESPDAREPLHQASALLAGQTQEAKASLERIFQQARLSGNGERAAEALGLIAWISWIDLDGEGTRTCAERFLALQVPKTSAEAFRMYLGQATMQLQLGQPREALQLLHEAENVSQNADIDAFASFLRILGDVHAALGDDVTSVHHAKLAVEISRRRLDRYMFWRNLLIYAYTLQSMGDVRQASATLDETLQAATAAQLTWESPLTKTRKALAEYLQGNLETATESITSALESDTTQKWMYVQRSYVGILIALATGNHDLLHRSVDEGTIDYAFQSADVYTIGPIVAAYHAYFLQAHRPADAARLLERGVGRITSPDAAWLLLPRIAIYGDESLVSQGRAMLETFPKSHPIASAFGLFFEALCAFRQGDRERSEILAGEAQAAFERTGWRIMLPRCMEAAGRIGEAQRLYQEMGAVAEATRVGGTRARPGRPRRGYERSCQRREVLRLVTTGASTAAIADRLGISCRTVKYRLRELYAINGASSRREFMELYSSGYFPSPEPSTASSAQILEDALLAHLKRLDITVQLFGHAPARTVEDRKALRKSLPGNPTKNLFLHDRNGRFWLLSLLEDTDVDLKSVAKALGSGRLSFAGAAQLQEHLGVLPGAISPLAACNDRLNKVHIALEGRMLESGALHFHPLRNDATMVISGQDLLAFLADCRHAPAVISL